MRSRSAWRTRLVTTITEQWRLLPADALVWNGSTCTTTRYQHRSQSSTLVLRRAIAVVFHLPAGMDLHVSLETIWESSDWNSATSLIAVSLSAFFLPKNQFIIKRPDLEPQWPTTSFLRCFWSDAFEYSIVKQQLQSNCTKMWLFTECRSASDFRCENNVCLPMSVKCDGYDQCGDGSDEGQLCGNKHRIYLCSFSCPLWNK